MLLLTRKLNEAIHLRGDIPESKEIVIKVLRISGKSVQLGFEAPRDVLILREELLARENDPVAQVADAVVKQLSTPDTQETPGQDDVVEVPQEVETVA